MLQRISEGEALRVLQAARARLSSVEDQRRREGTFVTGIRLAHAKAIVQAERLTTVMRASTLRLNGIR